MYAISPGFVQALQFPSIASSAFRAEAWRGSLQLASPLMVIGGKLSVDSTASVWRNATVQVIDPTGLWIPSSTSSVLTPYGNELKLYGGLNLPSGVREMLPLGVFHIDNAVVDDHGERIVSLTCLDRSYTVSQSRVESPYNIPAGTNYTTAMIALLLYVFPGCPISFAATPHVTPQIVINERDDPWKALSDMAASLGNQLLFDPMGTCVMRAQPNPSVDPPVWSYGDGTQSTTGKVQVAWDAHPGYNEYIVESNAPGIAPVRGVAKDMDPTSPTFYDGPYGHKPEWYSSPMVTTQAQADDAALGGVLVNKGGTQTASFEQAASNVAHEGLDVVQVARAVDGLASSLFVLESFDIDLKPAPMALKCRKRSAI